MDFKHLRYFVTLAKELHMGRAAEILGIAQPALSQQIKALEERLNVRLFIRAHRRLTLTQAGEAFEQKARLALNAAESAINEAQRTARGEQGSVAIGHVPSAMLNGTLPRRLGEFHRQSSRVKISLYPQVMRELFAGLAAQTLDIAIVRAPLGNLPAELESKLFARESLLLVMPDHHPLADLPAVPMQQLAEDNWLLMSDPAGIGLEQTVRDACAQAGFTPRIGQHVQDAATIVSLAAAGLGIGLVPDSVSLIALPGVRFIPPENPLPASELWLVYRRFERSAAVRKLLAVLMGAAH
ncbi:LysR substrate-binding domain-containing protein [Edaphovirga cremea]|uniref:LysR substrate-binding domain-containing protein n=1 Tax=Edaphovirga cremea TaxID=2267246 RepID=UPI000DEFEF00|nr:LysR substrate-binding domain-containing protein [Edaphovirga cremea]